MARQMSLLEYLGAKCRGEDVSDVEIPGLQVDAQQREQAARSYANRLAKFLKFSDDELDEALERKGILPQRFCAIQRSPEDEAKIKRALLAHLDRGA